MSQFDQTIPLLTEVFSETAATPAAPVADTAPAPLFDARNAHLEQLAITSWTEPEWQLMEQRLSERILQQLQGRVDFVLEQRVRDSMEEVLKLAVAGLTNEIRNGLHDTIEKIVVRAVAQEVAHLQALKK